MIDPVKVSPLIAANAVVPDAAAAVDILGAVFNAPELPAQPHQFDGSGSIRAAGMGDLTINFVPGAEASPTLAADLARQGAFFHSLVYEVDDLARAERLLGEEGIVPSGLGEAQASGTQRSLYFDTVSKIGFGLHLFQADAARRDWGTGGKRIPAPHGDTSPLLHIELVTEDMADVERFLNRIFGTTRIEVAFASFLTSFDVLEVVHLGLGDTVLQYCRPIVPDTSWDKLLRKRGRSVHNVTWLVPNMAEIYYAYRGLGFDDLMDTVIPFGMLFGEENVPASLSRAHIMNAMDSLGFGIELTENFAANMNDYLHNPIAQWREAKTYVPRLRPFTNSRVGGTDGIM